MKSNKILEKQLPCGILADSLQADTKTEEHN